jgi:eukaryotic-like serine/threonine-protein kinase
VDSNTPTAATTLEGEVEVATPTRVGRFVVLDRIGSGGMGTVLRAYDPKLERRVAVKVLRLGSSAGDPAAATRLQREAMALARLSHPNVVTIHEVGTSEGQTFLAMEHVAGVDLAKWMRAHPHGAPERRAAALEILQQAGRGLAAAHEAGLVHRDFKPANVLIGDSEGDGAIGRVRVADFGLVRARGRLEGTIESVGLGSDRVRSGRPSDESAVTEAGELVGTLRYMPPEQQSGRSVDPRSDQFSFCVTAWELLFGCPPWPHGACDDPPNVPADAPRWQVAVLARGLQVDPDARWPDMPSLLAALANDPRRRRRMWALGASVVLVGGLVATGVLHRRATICDDGPDALAITWNDARREALADRFVELAADDAGDAWTRTEARMQAFADEWRTSWDGVCDAGRRRGELDPAALRATLGCLDVRRVDFEASLGVLEAGDRETMAHAIEIAYALPSPSACERRPTAEALAMPESGDRADEVLTLTQALTTARVIGVAGDWREALAHLDAVAPAIRDLDHPALALQAEQLRATALDELNRDEEANDAAIATYWTALRTGEDGVAAVSASILASNSAPRGAYEAGDRWIRYAQVLAERAEVDDAERARIETEAAKVRLARSDFEGARVHLQLALELGEGAWGARHPQNVPIYYTLARAHRMASEFDDAIRVSRDTVAICEEAFGPDALPTSEAIQTLAGVLNIVKEYDEAEALCHRVIAIRTAWLGEDHPALASALGDLGAVYGNAGRAREALPLFERAQAILRARLPNTDPVRLQMDLNVARALQFMNRLDEAVVLASEVVRIHEERGGPDRAAFAKALYYLGTIQLDQRRYAQARATLERALAIDREIGGERHIDTLSERVMLARIDHETGELAAAEAGFRKVLEHATDRAGERPRGAALTHLGVILQDTGRRAEALARNGEALEIVRAKSQRVTLFRRRVELLQQLGRPKEARAEAQRALPEARELGNAEAIAELEKAADSK